MHLGTGRTQGARDGSRHEQIGPSDDARFMALAFYARPRRVAGVPCRGAFRRRGDREKDGVMLEERAQQAGHQTPAERNTETRGAAAGQGQRRAGGALRRRWSPARTTTRKNAARRRAIIAAGIARVMSAGRSIDVAGAGHCGVWPKQGIVVEVRGWGEEARRSRRPHPRAASDGKTYVLLKLGAADGKAGPPGSARRRSPGRRARGSVTCAP